MVSVIVPVYNVEKYLRKCIESILNQSNQDFELILVNDGSEDGSGQICTEYTENPKVKAFSKKNGGLSDARNFGIEMAEGEYITFIDSDDWVDSNYLSILVDAAKKNNSDMVSAQLNNFFEGETPQVKMKKLSVRNITKQECYYRMLMQKGMDVNATAKLFRRNVFENIRFVKGRLYEDINIVDQLVEASSVITVINYDGYYYLQRKDSIMYGKFDTRSMLLLESTQHLTELMRKKYPLNLDAAIRRDVYCNFHLLGRSIMDDDCIEYSRQFRKHILEQKTKIFTSSIYTNKERVATILLMMGLSVYKKVWAEYRKTL